MSPEPSLRRARLPRWKLERCLVDQLADPLLGYDTALVAIASAFGAADCAPALWDWLDDAARPLFATPSDLRERAAALTDLMTNHLCLRAHIDGWESLTLDHTIATRSGHPVLLATVGHELARRAGWQSLTARSAGRHVTVLTTEGYFTPIAYGAPLESVDIGQLRACCPHEVAYVTLTALSGQAPAELAESARRVRDGLPIERDHHAQDW